MAAATSSTSKAKVLDESNPFPGLRYFVESEAQFFVGRDAEIRELIRRIRRDPLTVLFGISGLGKTSLLLAGVFPQLRASGYFPVRLRLEYFKGAGDFASQIVQQTRTEAAALGIDSTEPNEGESLWEYFHRAEFWGRRSRLLQPVLVLDQFEEIFSLGAANRDARVEPFVEELGDLIENRIPKRDRRRIAQTIDLPFSISKQPYRVVLSMREDFVPELEAWHRRIPAVRNNRMRLRPMAGVAAIGVVRQVPDTVTAEVAEKIVRDVAKDDESPLETLNIEPALLSVVCRELNRRRIAGNLPVITEDLLQGASEELLQNLYDECLDKFPEIRDVLQREIEEELLTRSGMRDNVAVEDFLDDEKGITEAVLQELVEERLVRIEERAGAKRIELSHDRWTDVVANSRDERVHREALEEKERERQQERAEAKAREDKLRKTFLRWGLAGAAALGGAIIVAVTIYNQQRALQQQQVALTLRDEQLSDALNEVQAVNRDFGAIQESVNVLGTSLSLRNTKDEQLLSLINSGRAQAESSIRGLQLASLRDRDDINENYAFLKSISDKVTQNSVDVAAQVTVEVDPGDSLPLLASTERTDRLPVAEMKRFNLNDPSAIQSTLDALESMTTEPNSEYANELLEYLSMTSYSVWTVTDLRRAFTLLDTENSISAQRAVSHLNLAAIGVQDMARDGNAGNALGADLRSERNTYMQDELADSAVQITTALSALEDATLNPRSRYNAMWYLSESDFSVWTDENRKVGCAVIATLNGAVGASTQAKVDEAKAKIGTCETR